MVPPADLALADGTSADFCGASVATLAAVAFAEAFAFPSAKDRNESSLAVQSSMGLGSRRVIPAVWA